MHQVPIMDTTEDLLVLPQGYLLTLTSFVWYSCWFNRHSENDMLINDPRYLFGIGLFLICPLSLISNTHSHMCIDTQTSRTQRGQEGVICFPEGPCYVYCCLHWRGQILFIFMTRMQWYTRIKRGKGGEQQIGEWRCKK